MSAMKSMPGDHALGNQVQAVGTDEDTGHDVGRHVGQPQAFGDAGHGEAANETSRRWRR